MIPIFNLKTIREKITFSPPIMPQPKKQGFWRSISNINEDRELAEQIFELRNCILFPIIENYWSPVVVVYDIKSTPSEIFRIEGTYDSNDDWIPKSLYLDSRFLVSMNPQQLSSRYNDQWDWIPIGEFFQPIPVIRDGRNNLYFFINLTNYDDFLRLNKLGTSLVTFLKELAAMPQFFNPEASGEWEIVEEEE